MTDPKEIMARSNAAFDGRPFDALGRADKERYLARASADLAALREAGWEVALVEDREDLEAERDMLREYIEGSECASDFIAWRVHEAERKYAARSSLPRRS